METYTETYSSLVHKHMNYAKRLAYKFYNRRKNSGVDLDDLIGAALLGLCDAAKKFDPSKTDNFKTYSYLRIRGSMYDLLRASGGVSRGHYAQICGIQQKDISAQCVPRPSEDAVSETEEQKDSKAANAERLPYTMAKDCRDLRRLTETIRDYGICVHVNSDRDRVDISYAWHYSPEDAAIGNSVSRYLDNRLEYLPDLEKNVIKQKYYREQSFHGMSEHFNDMSKSWLSRLHLRALGNLKTIMEADGYHKICEINTIAA